MKHKHDYYLSVETILTPRAKGLHELKNQIFLECLDSENECAFIVRGNEIITYIQSLENIIEQYEIKENKDVT